MDRAGEFEKTGERDDDGGCEKSGSGETSDERVTGMN
jgi:hypothetical protein